MYWFVGDGTTPFTRLVYYTSSGRMERNFERITGIHVQIEEDTICGQGDGDYMQTLRINATRVELDRTAVQCIASAKVETVKNYASYYGVLLVTGKHELSVSQTLLYENLV